MSWSPFDPDGEERDGEPLDPLTPNGDGQPFPGFIDNDEDEPFDARSGRWPLDPRGLYPRERWLWFEQAWADACMLRERYRVSLRAGWWEDEVQVEAIAAMGAWIERYDSGEWDDPPGKLALLYDLERVALLLRDGLEPFFPARDRAAFLRHLVDTGCQPPPAGA